jgi:hypothetical protein
MTAFQTFTAGQILTAAQCSALQANSTAVAIFEEQFASGLKPGVGTSAAWTKRGLNTSVLNNIAACSIAASVVTLTAGSYVVRASAPFYKIDSVQLRLRNTTAGSNLVLGQTNFVNAAVASQNYAFLNGYFTLTGSTTIELQYYFTGPSINTNDLGVASSIGTEVYAQLMIQQVA